MKKAVSREKSQKRKDQKKEDAGARKGRKVAKHCVFSWFCGSGGLKVGSLKRRVRRHLGRWEMKSCTPLWRGTFRSQNVKNTRGSDHFWRLRCRKSARRCQNVQNTPFSDHFWSWDVEKVHAVVARSTFPSQKCTKHTILGPLLEVEMSKECTPLWREAHFQVKMYKTHQLRTTFGSWDVEKVHAVVARSTFRSQNVQNTTCLRHFWRFRCRFAWQAQGDCGPCQKWAKREGFVAFSTTTTTTLHYTPIHYTTLQLQLHLHYILLHYTPLHYTALNYTQLHYTTLHSTTLRYTPLH